MITETYCLYITSYNFNHIKSAMKRSWIIILVCFCFAGRKIFTKQILIFIVPIFICTFCFAQTQTIDSLKKVSSSLHDAPRIDCFNALSEAYTYLKPDTATMFAIKACTEALEINYWSGAARSFRNRAYIEGKALGHFRLQKIMGGKL